MLSLTFFRRSLQKGRRYTAVAVGCLVFLSTSSDSTAQWLKYPTAGVPRNADGAVDVAAPAPRLPDGKPDFSGVWTTAEPNILPAGVLSSPSARNTVATSQDSSEAEGPGDASVVRGSRQMANIGVDIPGGLPYQPWLVPIVKARIEKDAIDDPHIRCLPDNFLRAYGLPHLLKFVHTPSLLVVLNEMNAGYRQVFTDGRPLPKDPNPTWQGYSSAKWSGDTLVIDTIGVRDDTWIDWSGSVLTSAAQVREEIRRRDFGHLEIRVTVDDPKAYTKPWRVTLKQRIVADAELIDEVCLENEKFGTRLK
jgi:hypothetical protein